MRAESRSRDAVARLLEHPAVWRGTSAARTQTVSSGFPELDARLPGGGWPCSGLVEILFSRAGTGELALLMPVLATLTRDAAARWCAWIAPPLEPFAPALAAHGIALERIFVARTAAPLWAFEQSLRSACCDAVLAWVERLSMQDTRRLQLAAERGRSLGFLFRSLSASREPSCAVMRLTIEPAAQGFCVTLLKSRGGQHGAIHLPWYAS
ncbi:MAG TPA: translesion DNA synthesis-associated protein ImuA [Steroidobacteraceae bacterium]